MTHIGLVATLLPCLLLRASSGNKLDLVNYNTDMNEEEDYEGEQLIIGNQM